MTATQGNMTSSQLNARVQELTRRLHRLQGEAVKRRQAEEALRERTHDLGERVKELNCLYAIYKFSERRDTSVDEILQGAADLIPPAWHYPDITSARITFGDRVFVTRGFEETQWRQASGIDVQGERVGAVEVFYLEEMPELDEGPFLKEERNLINAIAEQLGLLIERVRAEEALRDSEQKLHALTQKVLSTQEEERARLSRELHDELGHQLATLRLELDWMVKHDLAEISRDNLDACMKLVSTATDSLRRICKGLRPMIPDYTGLGLALEALVQDFSAHSGLSIDVEIAPVDDVSFSPEIAINVYRMLQEILTNVARHSGAKHVNAAFGLEDGMLVLDVNDDGRGIGDMGTAEGRGVGLVGMRERAALCGGRVDIDTGPGRGARVTVRIPLPTPQKDTSP